MDQRKVLILAGVLGILLLVIIIGTVAYISSSRSASNQPSQKIITSSPLPIPSTNIPSNTSGAGTTANSNLKTYSGNGFSIQYPKAWGLLTCSNSQNFEFNPENSTDHLKVLCSRAVEPITVLVHSTPVSCPGSKQTFGSITATKAIDANPPYTDYRYCTQSTPQLDISTRYSPNGGTAVSTTDYSKEVEQLISNISFTH